MQKRFSRRLCAVAGSFMSLTVFVSVAAAQTLTWGVNGAGGSGNWDATTANWFNGSQNVVWPSGDDAIFAGASGGTVNSYFFGPVVNSITFNTAGYSIQNGYIQSGANGLSIVTNVDATIGSTLDTQLGAPIRGPNDVLKKSGPAALIINGSTYLDAIQINQGELRITGFASVTSSNFILADAPGATLTFAPSVAGTLQMQSLAGGGSAGGIVQPNDQARTINLELFSGAVFGGTLQNNGTGILGLDLFMHNATETLTNLNTYSGPTTIDFGTLTFAGNGSALNSAISIATSSTLVLDNSGSVLSNRISDSAVVALTGGVIQFKGNASIPVEEIAGPLNLSGASSITVTQSGGPAAQLTFSSFQRIGHATLSIVGPGVKLGGLSNGGTGIIAPYITAGSDWATVGGDGRVVAFSSYATDINSGSTSDHIKLSGGGTTVLSADMSRASLNLQNSSTSGQVLDFGGHSLALTSGGILSSGSGTATVHSGSLSTSSNELVITASNNIAIDSKVIDGGSSTTLTKTGAGALTLTGTNTYTGQTAIMQGTLVVSSDANLGSGKTIEFSGGKLQAAGSFISTKGFTGNSSASGTIDTGGFNLSFSGTNNGAGIIKTGLGSLTLSTASPGRVLIDGGLLVLPNATSGNADLIGGTLQVAGTLTFLDCGASSGIPILDLGGPAAARVTTGNFNPFGTTRINFGLGSAGSDFLAVTNGPMFFPSNTGAIQYEFANLGGVRTGVDYPLMSFSTFSAPSPSTFAFAPDMAAAGWKGAFKTTTTGVSVRFTSVPEPSAILFMVQAAIIGFALRRRFSMRRIAH